jgi:uncharacterized protein involved in exopolysaccharide biosynthesis
MEDAMIENATEQPATEEWRRIQSFADYEEEPSIDLAAIFSTLLRGRMQIAAATVSCLLLATVVAFLLPFRYTSVTSFIPPSLGNNSSMLSAIAGQLSGVGAGDLFGANKPSAELYAGILKSRSVTGELVKRFDLTHEYRVKKESQAEKALQASTNVAIDTKSSIITVGVTAKSPDLAQKLASAYMDALRQTNGRLALSQSSQRRLFFEQQLAKEKNDLADAEVELKKTEESSGLIAPAGQTEAQIRTIAETQAQIAVRQVQLASLLQSATEQNPEVVRLRSEISDLQTQLTRLQIGKEKQSSVSIPTSKVPEVQLEYVRKLREVKYHEALFEALARQYEAARLDESRESPLLQILDPASFPDSKSSPKRMLIMALGALIGSMSGFVWVLLKNRKGLSAAV